jgi:trigger factor
VEQRATAEVRRQLVEQILEANPFEVPGSMVDRYLDYMTGGGQAEREKERSPEEEERFAKIREACARRPSGG